MEQVSRFYKQPKMKQKEYLDMVKQLYHEQNQLQQLRHPLYNASQRDFRISKNEHMTRRAINSVRSSQATINGNLNDYYNSVNGYHYPRNYKKRSNLFQKHLVAENEAATRTRTVRKRPLSGPISFQRGKQHPRSILKNSRPPSVKLDVLDSSNEFLSPREAVNLDQSDAIRTNRTVNFTLSSQNLRLASSLSNRSHAISPRQPLLRESVTDFGTLLSSKLSELKIKSREKSPREVFSQRQTQLQHDVRLVEFTNLDSPDVRSTRCTAVTPQENCSADIDRNFYNDDFLY